MLVTGCSNNKSNIEKYDNDISATEGIVKDRERVEKIVNVTLPEIEGEPITRIIDTTDSVVIGMTEKEDRYYFFDNFGNFLFSTVVTDGRPVCYQKYIFVKDKIIDYKGNVLFDVNSSEFRAISFVQMLDEGKIICAKDENLYVVDFLRGTSNVVNQKEVRFLRSHYMGNGYYVDTHKGLVNENVWIYNALSDREYSLYGDEDGTFHNHFFSDLTYQCNGENVYYWMDDAIDLGQYCLELATGKVEFQKWKNGLKNMKGTSVKYVYLSGNDIFDAGIDRSILLDNILNSVFKKKTMEIKDVFNKTYDGKYLLYIHDSDEPQNSGYYFSLIDSLGNVVFSSDKMGFIKFEKHSNLVLIQDEKTKFYYVYDYKGNRIFSIEESDAGNKSLLGKDSIVLFGKPSGDVLYVTANNDTLIRIEDFELKRYSKECDTYFGIRNGCFFGVSGGDASSYCLSIIDETEVNMVDGEYVLPNSNSSYLNQEDIRNLSAEELRIARNEIYARHGRRFQSQDLQEYFESKGWYHGTIEPSDFKESLLNDFEKKNAELIKKAEERKMLFLEISNLPVAPSKRVIDRYGYENGYSVLSFHTIKGTLKDCGEYYQIDAVYRQAIEAPRNLRDGEQITLVFNELTGETKTLTYHNDRFYPEGVTDYYQAYYYPTSDGKSIVLYQDSEDRIDKPVYEGKLYIRKDATWEIDITNQVEAVTSEILDMEFWYNGVYFDEKGYVTRLVSYGD